MALFGERARQVEYMETFTQPAWLTPQIGEARWRSALKSRLTRAYFPLAKAVRRVKKRLHRMWSWRKPLFISLVVLAVLLIAATAAVLVYRIWRVPHWVLSGATTSDQVISRVDAYRSSLIALLSVLIQTVGGFALLTGLFFTWRQIVAGQEAQVSERFTRAVEQLASERIDVRVGGIHGLERISIGRESERESVKMILSAFVLQRSREHDPVTTDGELPLDLQIALAVLVQSKVSRAQIYRRVSLRGANFAGARLEDIDFSGFDLNGADFRGASLEGASFRWANLGGADFQNAKMRYVNFSSAFLVKTNFRGADLQDALFRNTVQSGLDFRDTDLTGADFEWAQVSGDFRGSTILDTLFYGATFQYSDLTNVDLRNTRGLADYRVKGAAVTWTGTRLPAKTHAEADDLKQSSGRPQFWQPPAGFRMSLRFPAERARSSD